MARNVRADTVVYQIYPRSYMDSNGDGIGDLRGIISKLDYIASLGVNTIWLSPVYQSPDEDNGYDISDYKTIQPHFGTMEDFEELVREARARGIDIIMDLVINHTSDEHEWFRRALAGEEKYKNYYIISKGKNGKKPNNWGNFFAECPWTEFSENGEYYLHLFSKKQPDLNWHNPDVMAEIQDIMHFWLGKGVKGFRCDVINVIYKNSLKNGRPRLILAGREHYMSAEGCHSIIRTLREKCLEPYGAWAVGETVFVTVPQARKLCEEERKELDMVFYFEHMECDQIAVKWFKTRLSLKKLMRTLTKWQTGLSWNAVYFENHDQPRFINRICESAAYREKASQMMAGLAMTLRGTPFVYEGQEIGMTNGSFRSLADMRDVEIRNVEATAKRLALPKRARWRIIELTSRDNVRTPMQWTAGENAGFSTAEPWLRVNPNHKFINAENELGREDGVLAFWKKMISLRKKLPALCHGKFVPVCESGSVYAYMRVYGKEKLLAVMNMSAKETPLPKEARICGTLVASNYGKREKMLKPFEFRLVRVKQ